jgi:hypothetical protein
MLLFDENGIGRFHEAIRGSLVMPDRPVTCERPEHPVQAESPGWSLRMNPGFAISVFRIEQGQCDAKSGDGICTVS